MTFRLASGDAQSFVAANGMINDWLKQQPGLMAAKTAGAKAMLNWLATLYDTLFAVNHATADAVLAAL